VFQPPSGVAVNQLTSTSGGAAAHNVALSSVLPSSRLVSENLGPVSIGRPSNWQVIAPQQQGADVMIAPRAGVTDNGLGYGVAINGVSARGQSMSLDSITTELMREWERTRDMRAVGSPQQIRVNGVVGRSVSMESSSPFLDGSGNPQKESDWLVTVPRRDGSVLYMVFIAPQSQFAQFRPTFESMLKSVQF
jgi:hypothetical protein